MNFLVKALVLLVCALFILAILLLLLLKDLHALSITVRAVLSVSKIFYLLCFCLITTKIYTRGIFMSFVCYRLCFNNTPFNVSFIKTLAKDKDNFPMIFYKNSLKIDGYFFFNCSISSVFLRKFCTDVIRMNEDSVSSWYFNEGGHIKYYTNNYYFIDDYINMSRLNVVDMFNYNSGF